MNSIEITRIKKILSEICDINLYVKNCMEYQEYTDEDEIWDTFKDGFATPAAFALLFDDDFYGFPIWNPKYGNRIYWTMVQMKLITIVMPEEMKAASQFILLLKKHKCYDRFKNGFLKYVLPSSTYRLLKLVDEDTLLMVSLVKEANCKAKIIDIFELIHQLDGFFPPAKVSPYWQKRITEIKRAIGYKKLNRNEQ